MQSAPQVAAVVDKPFIYASIKDLLDPGTTMQTNSRSTIADAQYSSTLSRLMREDPMYASASFNSAPNTLIPGRLTVEYPPGKLPAVVPPVQVDIGQLIALRAQYKQDLCIALGMPIEFLIGDNSTVVAGAEGSRARANSALVGLQAPLIPFLEQIIGAYYRDVLLDAMQMTPEEETRETRKDDEIRRKNEVGVVTKTEIVRAVMKMSSPTMASPREPRASNAPRKTNPPQRNQNWTTSSCWQTARTDRMADRYNPTPPPRSAQRSPV